MGETWRRLLVWGFLLIVGWASVAAIVRMSYFLATGR